MVSEIRATHGEHPRSDKRDGYREDSRVASDNPLDILRKSGSCRSGTIVYTYIYSLVDVVDGK